nr:M56 family metallopeptidase [uncultured Psychroserpens sp.]
MLHYILQVVAFQLLFLIIYDVFLRKETFFNLNRIYLLVTTVLSVVIPFVKIEQIKNLVAKDLVINLPEVFIGNPQENINAIDPEIAIQTGINLESQSISIWAIILISGMCIATLILVFKISKLVLIASKYPKHRKGSILIINLLNSTKAFSFFNYIFLGEKLNVQEKASILQHELVHVQQKHTLDLLVFEILRIVFWFNPLIYMYQNRIATLHEYIADAQAVKHHDKANYYDNLLAQVFETQQFSFVNPFFKHSLIKKRILMLSKSKSRQINLSKYLLIIPLILGMLVYSSCSVFRKKQDDTAVKQENTVVKQESVLITQIQAIKNQIQIQGNTTPDEENGLNLLLKTIEAKSLDMELVENVQSYINAKDKTSLMDKIAIVLNQIQVQGNLSDVEVKTLKELLVLTTNDGLHNPVFKDVVDTVEIPFGVVDQVPIYKSCETLETNEERKKCMSQNISKHVNVNFNIGIADSLKLVGRQRINVIFKIDKEGYVTGVRARAPHPKLEEEAIRVVQTLPQFIPGKHTGKTVIVPYSLPIVFQIQGKSDTKPQQTPINNDRIKELKEKFKDADEVPFVALDKAPSSDGCKDFVSEKESKSCFSGFISGYVNKNFNVDLASKLGLVGKQRINVLFKVDKEGKVTNARARAPHPDLETEALRVINNLPQFTPGELNGKPVTVNYSLPILFQVTAKANADKKN